MIVFSPKGPRENEPFQIDFVLRLVEGETITAATVIMSVAKGPGDPDPSAMLAGPTVVSGSIVQQSLQGGLFGNSYYALFEVTTSLGHIYDQMAVITIKSIATI